MLISRLAEIPLHVSGRAGFCVTTGMQKFCRDVADAFALVLQTRPRVQALAAYVRTFPFESLSLDTAFRAFADTFKQPPESQQVVRFTKAFVHAFLEAHGGDYRRALPLACNAAVLCAGALDYSLSLLHASTKSSHIGGELRCFVPHATFIWLLAMLVRIGDTRLPSGWSSRAQRQLVHCMRSSYPTVIVGKLQLLVRLLIMSQTAVSLR
jgi:Sec7 domain